jgi:hypothetical protein
MTWGVVHWSSFQSFITSLVLYFFYSVDDLLAAVGTERLSVPVILQQAAIMFQLSEGGEGVLQ